MTIIYLEHWAKKVYDCYDSNFSLSLGLQLGKSNASTATMSVSVGVSIPDDGVSLT